MSIYNKHPIEKLSDEYDTRLNQIPKELEFLYEETDMVCPNCGEVLQRCYIKSANNMDLDVEYDMLYCATEDTYQYQHDITWKNNGGSIANPSSNGLDVKVLGKTLSITTN